MTKTLSADLSESDLLWLCSMSMGCYLTSEGDLKEVCNKMFRKSYKLLSVDSRIKFREMMRVYNELGMNDKIKAFMASQFGEEE